VSTDVRVDQAASGVPGLSRPETAHTKTRIHVWGGERPGVRCAGRAVTVGQVSAESRKRESAKARKKSEHCGRRRPRARSESVVGLELLILCVSPWVPCAGRAGYRNNFLRLRPRSGRRPRAGTFVVFPFLSRFRDSAEARTSCVPARRPITPPFRPFVFSCAQFDPGLCAGRRPPAPPPPSGLLR
jgi:hypothetical protein